MRPPLLKGAKYVGKYAPKRIICHCILLDIDGKLHLIDTGFGMTYVRQPNLLSLKYRASMGPSFDKTDTIAWQMIQLGYSPEMVTDIYLTHLHVDHAGGLLDFPNATVHTIQEEYDIAMNRPKREHRRSYYQRNWNSNTKWKIHQLDSYWHDFPSSSIQLTEHANIHFVHLPGHTSGHCGLLITIGAYSILHCGDAFLDKKIITNSSFEFPKVWRIFRWFIADDDEARANTVGQLRKLVEQGHLSLEEITCGHDEADLLKQQRRASQHFNYKMTVYA